MIPAPVMHVLATMALLCSLSLEPVKPWEPEAADVDSLARTLYGECRGCSELQQKAVCWCVFNQVDDSRFPNSITGVVSAPYQFAGYKTSFPVTDELYDLARECIIDWHNGENRVLDEDMCWFSGWGGINHFRNAWLSEKATKFWEEQ